MPPLAVHQNLVQAGFAGRKLTNATSVGVDPMVQAIYGVLVTPCSTVKTAPTDSSSAAFATYYANCHGNHELPFCHAQAKAWSDSGN